MASGPITSWEIDGEIVETVSDFIWGGSQITADGDCSHEIKRRLLLGRKVMNNLDSILKSRDVTLSTIVCLVKAMVFPVVMYRCESWTIKKAEHWRIDAFELWFWRRLFFFNSFIHFNWMLITLQYCNVFLPYIDMDQSWVYMCSPSWTPLPSPYPSHPSGSSQCISPEHPVSCIEPGLVICSTYGNIHVPMLFSQIIPPSPSPTESKSLFFTSVSLLLSHI